MREIKNRFASASMFKGQYDMNVYRMEKIVWKSVYYTLLESNVACLFISIKYSEKTTRQYCWGVIFYILCYLQWNYLISVTSKTKETCYFSRDKQVQDIKSYMEKQAINASFSIFRLKNLNSDQLVFELEPY